MINVAIFTRSPIDNILKTMVIIASITVINQAQYLALKNHQADPNQAMPKAIDTDAII